MATCKECGEVIFGRADKKFCDEQCRSAYHNKLKREESVSVSQINRILMKNRRVLKEFVASGVTELPLQKLVEAGFLRNYITSYYVKEGKAVLLYYEFSLSTGNNGIVHIFIDSAQ